MCFQCLGGTYLIRTAGPSRALPLCMDDNEAPKCSECGATARVHEATADYTHYVLTCACDDDVPACGYPLTTRYDHAARPCTRPRRHAGPHRARR